MTRRASRGARAARIARSGTAALVLAAAGFGLVASGDAANLAARSVASWQLVPATDRAIGAILSGFGAGGGIACAAAAATLAATALLGRWYCAALCPLGTLQDLASLLGRGRRAYARPLHPLRAAVFVAVVALAAAGAASLASWVDPWSLFARFSAYDLQSLLRLARSEDLPGLSAAAVAASGAAVLAVLAASFLSGRWFCGNLCPAGSALGLLNAAAPLRVRLDGGSCVSCGACASVCRGSCIEAKEKRLDSTRCVNCLACLSVCPTGAIRYGPRGRGEAAHRPARRSPVSRIGDDARGGGARGDGARGLTRAQFLAAAGGGIAALSSLALPARAFAAGAEASAAPGQPVLPPGARSVDRFLGSCVACGLCVSRCPSKVLQPALGQLGVSGVLVPRLDHSVSYCQYDCTACMDACPSGALEKLALERKRVAKIGDATLARTRCVVFTNETKCGACAEHCPTGAVRMVAGETGLPEPVFTSSICIGCGACHHACPVRPDRAITVSGLALQTVAERPSPTLFDTPANGSEPRAAKAPPAADDSFPF